VRAASVRAGARRTGKAAQAVAAWSADRPHSMFELEVFRQALRQVREQRRRAPGLGLNWVYKSPAMIVSLPQGELTIRTDVRARSALARAGTPPLGPSARQRDRVRDSFKRLALAHPHYGYRRSRRPASVEAFAVNHKRVPAPDARGQSACGPEERPSCRGRRRLPHVWRCAELERGWCPTDSRSALSWRTSPYIRLQEEFAFLAIVSKHSACS